VLSALYTPGMDPATLSPRILSYETEAKRLSGGNAALGASCRTAGSMLQTLTLSRRRQIQLDIMLGLNYERHLPSVHRHRIVGESVGVATVSCHRLHNGRGAMAQGSQVFTEQPRRGGCSLFMSDAPGDIEVVILLV